MLWLLDHEKVVHYAQIRPMRSRFVYEQGLVNTFEKGGGITLDCSEAATFLCKMAGLKDPNGRNYDGTGYTGSLLANLPHYSSPAGAGIGALVVFGPGDGDHVATVLEPGKDPLLWSHGQERGPIAIRLSQEKKYQAEPTRFLNISSL